MAYVIFISGVRANKMESEGPPKTRIKSCNCVICDRPLSDEPATKNPTERGIRTLLDVAQVRQDTVHERLSSSRDDILAGNVQIAFHRSCRASYTTKRNVQLVAGQGDSGPKPSTSQGADSCKRLKRTDTQHFNIRNQCFVCAKSYRRNEKLTPISTGTGASTHDCMLRAAVERLDEQMRQRMLAHPDLFAFDASYHRSCYAEYISKRNIQAAKTRTEREQLETPFQKGFKQFCEELEGNIFSGNKPVVLLSEIHSRFVEILHTVGAPDPDAYRSWKLKEKLIGQFGDRLIFISQSGKSDLICSKYLTLGDALKRVNTLHIEKSEDGTSIGFAVNEFDPSDSMILHKAASVVRKSIANVSFMSDSYPSSREIGIEKSVAFVPTPLIEFISWCTSRKAFEGAMSFADGCATDNMLQILAICQNVIGLSNNIPTPISFGLGIQLHHKFGSRQLIEVLHELGHSIPYDEVRRFLTSVAEDDQRHGETYVPRGIVKYKEDDVFSIVDAAIDNFDQNEETLDGRSTTHSMAAVLYQRTRTKDVMPGIPKSKSRALDASQYVEDKISFFSKPHTRAEPKRIAETSVFGVQADCHRQAVIRDLAWKISRIFEDISLPAWSGFNAMVSESEIPVAIVRYLPFIKAPPTDFSTVYTVLLQLISIARSLGQHHILVTADLAIYSKAEQILWTKLELQDSVTMRLGMMHLIMAFLASIGKLYGDGGFLDILTSSGVYATATAQLMLQGKHYARGIRGVKVAHEAMTHLFLSAAETYAKKNGLPWIDDEVHTLATNLQSSIQMKNQSSCSAICLLLENKIANCSESISQFQAFGKDQSGTFIYWNSFLEAGDLLLRLIRADKEADFALHLDSVMETIPYFHLAGRTNYARYTPVYVSEMRQLETKQPVMHQFLSRGGFVVRRSDKTKFNSVPTDQALEQTINREAKGTGGVIGFTLRKSALLRWLLTRHVSGEYSEAFQELLENKSEGSLHKELGQARISRDKADVMAITDYIKDHCQNPFDLESIPKELVNITTGQIATKAVEESLTSIPEKGKTILNTFLTARLVDGETKSFWDAIPKSTVVTFASMKKALTFDKDRKMVLDPEVLFRRLLSVAKHRDIDMRMVLSYELTPVPPALFHDDGTIRKVTKSDLAEKLEGNCPQETELKSKAATAYIIDGMCFVQGLNEAQFKTFDDLGEIMVNKLTRMFSKPDLHIQTLALVFDRYDVTSTIKGNERQRRGDIGGDGPSHQIMGKRQVPHFRQFLKSGPNKAALIYFLAQYLEEHAPDRIPEDRKLVIAGGHPNREVVREITDHGTRDLEELFSNHDEADTRMILHATHSSSFPRTIVRCDDTDVLVLLVYYQSRGELSNEVYMHAGHTGKFVTRERFIPVTQIVKAIGMEQCSMLPAVHALTGCDSTSGFFKLGKKTAYTTFQKHQDAVKGLAEFHSPEHDDGLDAARELLLLMYGKGRKGRSSWDTFDEMRFQLSATTDKPVSSLPPTDDAFRQHALRAKFQTMIWCRSHIAKPRARDPTEYGWIKQSDECLQCVTSLKESAPTEIRDLTHLYCKDTNCTDGRKCACVLAGLKCIEICSCNNCPNTVAVLQDDEDGSDDED